MEYALREFVCICILAKMHIYFGWDVHFGVDHILDKMCILVEMYILGYTFGDHIYICFLVAMNTYFAGDAHLSTIVYTYLRKKWP